MRRFTSTVVSSITSTFRMVEISWRNHISRLWGLITRCGYSLDNAVLLNAQINLISRRLPSSVRDEAIVR